MATVEVTFTPLPAHVRTARLVAAAMARRSGVDEALLDEVRLAVGEACARAVRLHERYGLTSPVTVEFVDRDRFVVAVLDGAPAEVGPAGTDTPSLDGQRAGAPTAAQRNGSPVGAPQLAAWADPNGDALGLALLGAVVQDVSVRPEPHGEGSRLVMSWP